MKKMQYFAQRDVYRRGVSLYILDDGLPVTLMAAKHEDHHPQMMAPVAWQMSDAEAQDLMQALWDQGYRPNSGEGTSAQVDAMRAHLEDMRTLVFDKERGKA